MADNYIDKIEVDGVERPIRDTSGSVRYDAAQNLTDAQKTQARDNIGSAPAGYGLGETAYSTNAGTLADIDTYVENGWWRFDAVGEYDAIGVSANHSVLRVDAGRTIVQTLFLISYDEVVTRRKIATESAWRDWEWVNPPMVLGVEYRTTERYLGRPVYIRLEEFAALPNNTTLTVSNVGVPSGGTLYVDNIVDYRAEFYNNSDVFSIPYNDVVDIPECNGSRYGSGITYSIRTKGVDYSNYAGRIWIKYTKQTD